MIKQRNSGRLRRRQLEVRLVPHSLDFFLLCASACQAVALAKAGAFVTLCLNKSPFSQTTGPSKYIAHRAESWALP